MDLKESVPASDGIDIYTEANKDRSGHRARYGHEIFKDKVFEWGDRGCPPMYIRSLTMGCQFVRVINDHVVSL